MAVTPIPSAAGQRRRTRGYDITAEQQNLAALLERLPPPGAIVASVSDDAPGPGWLECDGTEYNVADYPDLFVAIGTRFGGTGVMFNVPDLRDSYLLGNGALAAGDPVGASSQSLTAGQMPSHAHGFTPTPHGHTLVDPGHGHGITDPGHDHTYTR